MGGPGRRWAAAKPKAPVAEQCGYVVRLHCPERSAGTVACDPPPVCLDPATRKHRQDDLAEVEPKLGCCLDDTDGEVLLIEALPEGDTPVRAWNAANPGSKVEVGDAIVEVNGTRGSAQALLRGLAGEKQPLELRLRRRAANEYIHRAGLWEALRGGDVVLVKGSWLESLASEAAARLPRRQDLPQGAQWDPEELFGTQRRVALGEVTVLAISYCWLTASHPDPEGAQLRALARVLGLFLNSGVADDFAIFLDWCSMYQAERTEEEEQAFKRSLRHINVWYAHLQSLVWILSDSGAAPAYGDRGWPNFECRISQLIKPDHAVLDLGLLGRAFFREQAMRKTVERLRLECAAGRLPPVLPEEFDKQVTTKRFTNGTTDLPMVQRKYRTAFEATVAQTTLLSFNDLGWDDEDLAKLVKVLPLCRHLRKLDLRGNLIGDRGAGLLAQAFPQCPACLEHVDLRGNFLPRQSARRLRGAWRDAGKAPRDLLLGWRHSDRLWAAAVAAAVLALLAVAVGLCAELLKPPSSPQSVVSDTANITDRPVESEERPVEATLPRVAATACLLVMCSCSCASAVLLFRRCRRARKARRSPLQTGDGVADGGAAPPPAGQAGGPPIIHAAEG